MTKCVQSSFGHKQGQLSIQLPQDLLTGTGGSISLQGNMSPASLSQELSDLQIDSSNIPEISKRNLRFDFLVSDFQGEEIGRTVFSSDQSSDT